MINVKPSLISIKLSVSDRSIVIFHLRETKLESGFIT